MSGSNNSNKGEVKNSKVALVRIGFDGRVHKWYRGPLAKERFENERRVLNYLEKQDCGFVPRVLDADPSELYLVTSNCGSCATKVSKKKVKELFEAVEEYGVRHHDQADRNITYNPHKGCFCVIDFEFAEILETGEGLEVEDAEREHRRLKALGHEF